MAGNAVSGRSANIANSVHAPDQSLRLQTPFLRAVLVGLALFVAAHTILGYRAWRQSLAHLTETARALGMTERLPGLELGMRRDANSQKAALRLARALLAGELDQRWILDLPEEVQAEERRRGLERLDVAYDLGVESLAARPGSWEALFVIGGAEYLRLSRRREGSLRSHRERWLAPLEEAHRLAPLQPEPLRFLAAADLGNWSVLPAAEKERAISRLRTAFQNPTTFDLLSAAWLRVAPSLDQALAIVPENAGAWAGLRNYFARRGDWERYCDAQRKATEAERKFFLDRLAEAENRLRWGDRRTGVQRLLWVGTNTRPDSANLAIMERVLALIPPGVGGEASARWLRKWLDWSLERCTQAEGCPLSDQALLRLTSLNRDLPPAIRAWALASAGSLRDAEAIERTQRKIRGEALGVDWTPYILTKARLLAARRDPLEAKVLLLEVPARGRDSVRYWQTHRDVATAAGDPLEAARAESWLAARARRRWNSDDWTILDRSTSHLELFLAEPAGGTTLRLDVAASGRGALELLRDGSVVEILPAIDGRTVDLDMPLTADLHTLEIRSVEGAGTAIAEVRLLPPRS